MVVKRNKDDAEAWHYLGLALNRDGDAQGARKALETAVKLRPDDAIAHTGLASVLLLADKTGDAAREAKRALAIDAQNAEAHYIIGVALARKGEYVKSLEQAEAAIKTDPKYAPAFLLKSQTLVNIYLSESFNSGRILGSKPAPGALAKLQEQQREILTAHRERFKEAAESLKKYIELASNSSEADLWREQLEALRVYAKLEAESDQRTVFLRSEVTTMARVLSKPAPHYTESARRAGVIGVVVLRAVLSSDGSVQNLLVFRSLGHGLTGEAIKAARKIKFTPAVKDGRPVSVAVMLEYYFSLF